MPERQQNSDRPRSQSLKACKTNLFLPISLPEFWTKKPSKNFGIVSSTARGVHPMIFHGAVNRWRPYWNSSKVSTCTLASESLVAGYFARCLFKCSSSFKPNKMGRFGQLAACDKKIRNHRDGFVNSKHWTCSGNWGTLSMLNHCSFVGHFISESHVKA